MVSNNLILDFIFGAKIHILKYNLNFSAKNGQAILGKLLELNFDAKIQFVKCLKFPAKNGKKLNNFFSAKIHILKLNFPAKNGDPRFQLLLGEKMVKIASQDCKVEFWRQIFEF